MLSMSIKRAQDREQPYLVYQDYRQSQLSTRQEVSREKTRRIMLDCSLGQDSQIHKRVHSLKMHADIRTTVLTSNAGTLTQQGMLYLAMKVLRKIWITFLTPVWLVGAIDSSLHAKIISAIWKDAVGFRLGTAWGEV